VRGRRGKSCTDGHFEVIAGKSLADDTSKCFAFVHRYDQKPKRQLFEVLKGQGMQRHAIGVAIALDALQQATEKLFGQGSHTQLWNIMAWFRNMHRMLKKSVQQGHSE